jgi:hypothetical protein
MDCDKQANLLHQHYQDTFQHLLYLWKARNLMFSLILVVLALMALDLSTPGQLATMVNSYLEKTVAPLDFTAIGSLFWFTLLCLVIQYYQRSIQVNRHYRYLSRIEDQLGILMGGPYIMRESLAQYSQTGADDLIEASPSKLKVPTSKKDNRPLLLKAVRLFYNYIFPFLLTLFVFFKLTVEGFPPTGLGGWLNFSFYSALILFNCLYIAWVWHYR